jgi:hypothetical protein
MIKTTETKVIEMQTLTGQPAQTIAESFPQPSHLTELVLGFRHGKLE